MKNTREFILAVVMVFFAISSLLGSSAQSSLNSAMENNLYNRNGWDAFQEDTNTGSVLRSLCEGLENNSTACYEDIQKRKSIGNYNNDLFGKLEKYYNSSEDQYKKYEKRDKWSMHFFKLGMLVFIIYLYVAFTQKN